MAGILSNLSHSRQESYFRDDQLASLRKLRDTLPPAERATNAAAATGPQARAAARIGPTVDQLTQVLAHSHLEQSLQPPRPVYHTALTHPSPFTAWVESRPGPRRSVNAHAGGDSWLREVNSAYRSVYRDRYAAIGELAESATKTVGSVKSARMAEGAVMAAGAFVAATAGVALVGIVGLGYLATHPSVVDSWKDKSKVLYRRFDSTLGEAIRRKVGTVDEMGRPHGEGETFRVAREIARGVARGANGPNDSVRD